MYYWLMWVETGTVSLRHVLETGSLVFVSSCQVVGTGYVVFVSSCQVVGTGSLVSVLFVYHVYFLIFVERFCTSQHDLQSMPCH